MFSSKELPKKFCDVHGKRMAYVELLEVGYRSYFFTGTTSRFVLHLAQHHADGGARRPVHRAGT